MTKKAAVLMIGNELLSGRTQETNMRVIAQGFAAKGIAVAEARIVADDMAAIVSAVRQLAAQYDYVVSTGGIGPTHDDITAQAMAEAFGCALARHAEAQELLRAYYGARLNKARLKMAYIPQGARLIRNPISRAPGFRIENVFALAGVPLIMEAMLEDVLGQVTGGVVRKVETISASLAEGELAEELTAITARFADVDIGSYPWFKKSSLGVQLVLSSFDTKSLAACKEEVCKMIRAKGATPS